MHRSCLTFCVYIMYCCREGPKFGADIYVTLQPQLIILCTHFEFFFFRKAATLRYKELTYSYHI